MDSTPMTLSKEFTPLRLSSMGVLAAEILRDIE
jgi:hypothetical protein